jgi:hypothetical protein
MSGLKLFSLGSLDITTGGSSASVAGLTEVGTSIVKGLENTGLTLDSGSSIYFDTNESNRMIITPGGSVGIGTSNPISELAVAGKIAITSELGASPTPPPDRNGWFYTKNDGAVYWQSHGVSETNLTTQLWEVDFYDDNLAANQTIKMFSNMGKNYSYDYPAKADGTIKEFIVALDDSDDRVTSDWNAGSVSWGISINGINVYNTIGYEKGPFITAVSSDGMSSDNTLALYIPIVPGISIKNRELLQCFVTTDNSFNAAGMETFTNIVIEI